MKHMPPKAKIPIICFSLPKGVYYLLLWLAVLFVLFLFRMPPLSHLKSNTYFQVDGSQTEAILLNTPAHMEKMLVADGHTLRINANIHVPNRKTIAVYKAKNAPVDMERTIKVFYPDDTVFEKVVHTETHAALFYDMAYTEVTGENSFFEQIENGRLDFYFYDSPSIGTPEEAARFIQQAGIAAGELQTLDHAKDGYYVFRPVVDGMPISHHDTFDSYRGTVNPNGCLELQVVGGHPRRLKGNFFRPIETLWESTSIIPLDAALQSLGKVLREDVTVEEIALVYQARALLGNPFEVQLIPMWELQIKDEQEMVSLVNAINGVVELYNSRS